jgi:hypothetical protein
MKRFGATTPVSIVRSRTGPGCAEHATAADARSAIRSGMAVETIRR